MKRELKVSMLVDFMASSFGTTDDEYNEIESHLTVIYPDLAFTFERKVYLHDLMEMDYDIFVFDWGGLLPGAEDLTRSMYRTLLGLTRKHDDKLYIMWSAFTDRYFKEAANDEFPEFIAPNVVYLQDDNFEKRCRLFFGLPEVSPVKPKDESLVLVSPPRRPIIGSSIFCQVDERLSQLIMEEADGRQIVDCGAGQGLLQDMLPTASIVSIDIIKQDNPKVLLMDSTTFPFKESDIPVFIRPCHSGFVEQTLVHCWQEVHLALYISKPENAEEDLGLFYRLSSIVHNEWTGTEGEKIYRIPFLKSLT